MSILFNNKKIELDYMSDTNSNITCIIEEMDLTKLSKTELLEKCEEYGITKCKSKKKSELIDLITAKIKLKENDLLIGDNETENDDDNKKTNANTNDNGNENWK